MSIVVRVASAVAIALALSASWVRTAAAQQPPSADRVFREQVRPLLERAHESDAHFCAAQRAYLAWDRAVQLRGASDDPTRAFVEERAYADRALERAFVAMYRRATDRCRKGDFTVIPYILALAREAQLTGRDGAEALAARADMEPCSQVELVLESRTHGSAVMLGIGGDFAEEVRAVVPITVDLATLRATGGSAPLRLTRASLTNVSFGELSKLMSAVGCGIEGVRPGAPGTLRVDRVTVLHDPPAKGTKTSPCASPGRVPIEVALHVELPTTQTVTTGPCKPTEDRAWKVWPRLHVDEEAPAPGAKRRAARQPSAAAGADVVGREIPTRYVIRDWEPATGDAFLRKVYNRTHGPYGEGEFREHYVERTVIEIRPRPTAPPQAP